jgi:hypothetical protein
LHHLAVDARRLTGPFAGAGSYNHLSRSMGAAVPLMEPSSFTAACPANVAVKKVGRGGGAGVA